MLESRRFKHIARNANGHWVIHNGIDGFSLRFRSELAAAEFSDYQQFFLHGPNGDFNFPHLVDQLTESWFDKKTNKVKPLRKEPSSSSESDSDDAPIRLHRPEFTTIERNKDKKKSKKNDIKKPKKNPKKKVPKNPEPKKKVSKKPQPKKKAPKPQKRTRDVISIESSSEDEPLIMPLRPKKKRKLNSDHTRALSPPNQKRLSPPKRKPDPPAKKAPVKRKKLPTAAVKPINRWAFSLKPEIPPSKEESWESSLLDKYDLSPTLSGISSPSSSSTVPPLPRFVPKKRKANFVEKPRNPVKKQAPKPPKPDYLRQCELGRARDKAFSNQYKAPNIDVKPELTLKQIQKQVSGDDLGNVANNLNEAAILWFYVGLMCRNRGELGVEIFRLKQSCGIKIWLEETPFEERGLVFCKMSMLGTKWQILKAVKGICEVKGLNDMDLFILITKKQRNNFLTKDRRILWKLQSEGLAKIELRESVVGGTEFRTHSRMGLPLFPCLVRGTVNEVVSTAEQIMKQYLLQNL